MSKPDVDTESVQVNDREQLIFLLCEAAEIEHGLMCSYLYAAWSLKQTKQEGLDDLQFAAVDRWLAGFLDTVGPDDLVMITADHGCDPTHSGTDHTREEVPLLVLHRGRADPLGTRDGFADIAATLAAHFALPEWPTGRPIP